MAYDKTLAARIRTALAATAGVTERKMFGGLCFLIDGRMCCGILQDEMIVRVAKGEQAALLQQPDVRVMDFTGRPMKGFVTVRRSGLRTPTALKRWIDRGAAVAAASPVKAGGRARSANSDQPARPAKKVRNT